MKRNGEHFSEQPERKAKAATEKVNTEKENPRIGKALKISLVAAGCAAVVAAAAFLFIYFGGIYYFMAADGVSVAGVDISGLTAKSAQQKLSAACEQYLGGSLAVSAGDSRLFYEIAGIVAEYDVEGSVAEAMKAGRENDGGAAVALRYTADSVKLKEAADQLAEMVYVEPHPSSYEADDEKIVIVAGRKGAEFDEKAFYDEIDRRVANLDGSEVVAAAVVIDDGLDLEALRSEYVTEPQAASVSTDASGKSVYVEGKNGYGFDYYKAKSDLEAAEPGDSFTYYFKDIEPTGEWVEGDELFSTLLAGVRTGLNAGEINRTHNITLAASYVNDTVLMPGDTFSFNGTVGERTSARGFRDAKIYAEGEVVDGLGGGICQLVSTIYSAALRADMEIVSRKNHVFTVSYINLGEDATVYWGSIDFKFKNNRDYPIRISASRTGSYCYVDIYGSEEDRGYDKIEIVTERTGTTPYSTVERTSSSLESGARVLKQAGSSGATVKTYKNYLDAEGELIKQVFVGTSTYKPAARIYLVGPSEEDAPTGGTVDPGTVPDADPTGGTDADPGTDPGENPDTDPGTGSGEDPDTGSGADTDPETDPGEDPGGKPDTEEGSGTGSDTTNSNQTAEGGIDDFAPGVN